MEFAAPFIKFFIKFLIFDNAYGRKRITMYIEYQIVYPVSSHLNWDPNLLPCKRVSLPPTLGS